VQQFRRKLAPYLFVNAVIVIASIFGDSDFFGITVLWSIYIAYKYAKLWTEGYDWRDVFRQPRDRELIDVADDLVENSRALFDRDKRHQLREQRRSRQLARRSLSGVVPPKMRGEVLDFAAGFTVVDDSYNSNPRSLLSMVRTLSETEAGARRRVVVAGEMLELGPESLEMHREAGREMARLGIDLLWGVRGDASAIIEGACEAGMSREATRFFESSEDAAAALVDELRDGDLVLVKGSRGVRTDKVVSGLRTSFALVGGDERNGSVVN